MVGNAQWNFKGREVGDKSRKASIVFAWTPKKTNGGLVWLQFVQRVSTIELVFDNSWFGKVFSFLGLDLSSNQEIIRYEIIKGEIK